MTTDDYDSITAVNTGTETLPDDIDTLKAALAAERAARRESETRAADAEAMAAHLKLLIAKLRHDRFGASSERGSKLLDQMELQLCSSRNWKRRQVRRQPPQPPIHRQ